MPFMKIIIKFHTMPFMKYISHNLIQIKFRARG